MSGVFGYVDPEHKITGGPLISKMASLMLHKPWYVSEWAEDAGGKVALGRLGIGIFNPESQPVWNAKGTVLLCWAGEIYNLSRLAPPGVSAEETLLGLYESEGEQFVQRLDGAFILAIWDRLRRKLILANDRFGMYPLYYSFHGGKLVFAPEVKGVLADESIPRLPDRTAMAQYMRFQQILGERTFLEDVQRLPGASILVYDLEYGARQVYPYWTYASIPSRPEITFVEAVEETGRLLRASVGRRSEDRFRCGVFLSGGLDSRILLGMVQHQPRVSFTFGAHNSRDVFYAGRIAKKLGSEHHWFDLPDGKWVLENLELHFALTEGFHNWVHAHGITILPAARQRIDVNLTGWDGGTILGHPLLTEAGSYDPVDDEALINRMFHLFTRLHTWPGLTEDEERLLYAPGMLKQVQGLAFDSFREELDQYLGFRRDVRQEFFFIDQHCLRLTQQMVTTGRSHIEFRFPYFDYALVDFLYSLPAHFRSNRRLSFALLQNELPELALVPYDHDEFLPTSRRLLRRAHAAGVKIRRRINRHLGGLIPERATLYADYEGYLRTDLREWAEMLLLEPEFAGPTIFSQQYLGSLLARHFSGREEWTIGKIAPVMTYIMVLKAFCTPPADINMMAEADTLLVKEW